VKPEEWQRVHALVDAALHRDPEERDTFLDAACAGRPSLRAAVVSLLRAHEEGGDRARAAQTRETPVPADGGGSPHVVGPYLIRHEIGRGGMGVVYLADDTRLSRRVALKALPPTITPDPGARERLRREARAAAALSHPGIATVYALEEIGSDLYLACEYVPGPTLRSMLEHGPLPADQIVDIALQLARALATAHALGVVHRDLKPENVVRTPSGVVKVLDFGVARVEGMTSSRLTQTGTIVGTPAYMAPEQARGEEADFRTDLFAFGVVLYEMASGSNPFEGRTIMGTIARILEFEPPALSGPSAEMSALDGVVRRCLNKDPESRYLSTDRLVEDLERLVGVSAPRAVTAASGPRLARRWWRTHQFAVTMLYVVATARSWQIKEWQHAPISLWIFVALGGGAMINGTIRGHLIFTEWMNGHRLAAERHRAASILLAVDVLMAIALLADGVLLAPEKPLAGVFTMCVALAIALASVLMEPATTAAAFSADVG